VIRHTRHVAAGTGIDCIGLPKIQRCGKNNTLSMSISFLHPCIWHRAESSRMSTSGAKLYGGLCRHVRAHVQLRADFAFSLLGFLLVFIFVRVSPCFGSQPQGYHRCVSSCLLQLPPLPPLCCFLRLLLVVEACSSNITQTDLALCPEGLPRQLATTLFACATTERPMTAFFHGTLAPRTVCIVFFLQGAPRPARPPHVSPLRNRRQRAIPRTHSSSLVRVPIRSTGEASFRCLTYQQTVTSAASKSATFWLPCNWNHIPFIYSSACTVATPRMHVTKLRGWQIFCLTWVLQCYEKRLHVIPAGCLRALAE
jgi:hypothetical protein